MLRFALLGIAQLATANPSLDSHVDTIRGDGWTVTGLEARLVLAESGLGASIHIAGIRVDASELTVADLTVRCATVEQTGRTVACLGGEFAASLPVLGPRTMQGRFVYDRISGGIRVEAQGLSLAGGTIELDARIDAAGTEILFTGRELQLADLLELGRLFAADALGGYELSGSAHLSGKLWIPAAGEPALSLGGAISAAAFANESGTMAGADVGGEIRLDLRFSGEDTILAIGFDADRGEAYVEPVYANFSEHRLRLEVEDLGTRDFTTFEIGRLRIDQDSVLRLDGSGRLALGEGETPPSLTANLEIEDAAIPNLYANFVQVLLAGTMLGNLETDGRLSGHIGVADNQPTAIRLRIDDAILDDRGGRFAVYGLSGDLAWNRNAAADAEPSELGWESGSLYTILFGGARARLRLGGSDVELLAPLAIPAMGGALRINRLALRNYGADDASGLFDADLEPIQLGPLAGAFGWPAFAGTLSGRLPLLTLDGETVTVGGTLSARLFDGTVEVANLRVQQPFGRVPRLQADLRLRDLDLLQVTEEFSFGSIQGRLSGDVTGLRMRNWNPVAMDLHFYTPADDPTPHRISQKAVENLAVVGGGGATAALSSGLLRYFEVYAYDRIGLRCVLRDEICAMSGAGPVEGRGHGTGYYIVKGRGLPRIDVVGYRDQVSWTRLIRQLGAIDTGGTPTVN